MVDLDWEFGLGIGFGLGILIQKPIEDPRICMERRVYIRKNEYIYGKTIDYSL